MKATRVLVPAMMAAVFVAGCGSRTTTPKTPPGGDKLVALKVPGMT